MATFKKLRLDEIAEAFKGQPPIISPEDLAAILGVGRSTIYQWIAEGRLDGAIRKRGKHWLVWRDLAIDILFNGPEWKERKTT